MITIGILIFPEVEELDFVAPFEVLSYVNKIQPNSTNIMLVIPGGKGRLAAMHNIAIINFIKKQNKTAKYITSVCTGAFLLAEAGLLTGKQATTYHTAFAELETYSVTVIPSKVIQDGNIITAGGVSSGLELGFYLLKKLFGSSISQEAARKIEYVIDVNTL